MLRTGRPNYSSHQSGNDGLPQPGRHCLSPSVAFRTVYSLLCVSGHFMCDCAFKEKNIALVREESIDIVLLDGS